MLHKKNKFFLFGAMLLSLFAVLVCSISTFAWFQLQSVDVNDVDDAGLVKTDTSSLSITDITAYKYKYNELSFGVTDYSNGEAVPYGSSRDLSNADREDRKNADVPSEGEGYYIVGDFNWVADCVYKKDGSTATTDFKNNNQWSYSASLRLDDDAVEGNNNLAIYNGFYFSAGTVFRVKKHTLERTSGDSEIANQVRPTDSYITSTLGTYVSSGDNQNNNNLFSVNSDGNFVVENSGAGYYNMFLFKESSTVKMSFVKISDQKTRSSRYTGPKGAISSKRSLSNTTASTSVYYLKPSSEWKSDSARFAVYYWGPNDSSGWVYMSETASSSGIYEAQVTDEHMNIIFVRLRPEGHQDYIPTNNGLNWDNRWNQTINLDASDYADGKICNITGWDNTPTPSAAVYIEYTIDGTNWERKLKGESTSTDYSESLLSLTTSSQFIFYANGTAYGYDELNSNSKPYCVQGDDNRVKVDVAGDYTVGRNASGEIYVNSHAAIIGYGEDDDDATWTYQSISSSLSLNADEVFKVVYQGTYYGYDHLINDGKTLFVAGDEGGSDENIKALLKGSYTITFNESSHAIGFTVTSSSFNSLSGDDEATYYLKSEHDRWNDTANYAVIAYDSSGNTGWFAMSSLGYDSIYSVTVEGTHTGLYFVRYGDSSGTYTIWNRTVSTAPGNASENWYIIGEGSASGTPLVYSGTWETFYEEPTETGYYLVGDSNFENGTGVTPWTFADINKLSETNLPMEMIGVYKNRHLSAGMQFQIWHFKAGSGRQGPGWNSINTDPQTTAALTSSTNITVNSGVDGNFDIYVTNTNKVMVRDSNEGTTLFYKYDDNEDSITLAKKTVNTGDDFRDDFRAVYEQGLHVTSAMASKGVYVGMVGQYAGKKTSCGTPATSYGFLGTSESVGFEGDGVADFTCLKIEKPGLYNFYWRDTDSKIYITSRPYLEESGVKTADGDDGYYMIPYNSSTSSTTPGSSTFTNGLKMKTVKGEAATAIQGNNNIAEFSRYVAAEGDKVYFKAFFNNRELKDTMPVTRSSDSVTQSLISVDSLTGVFTFLESGTFNIFMFKDSGNSGVRTISVAKDSLTDFSTLNSIPSDADTESKVLAANTTLIIDVEFSLETPANMEITLDVILSSDNNIVSPLSGYVKYALFVDPENLDGSISPAEKYNYFRDNSTDSSPYKQLVSMDDNTSFTASGAVGNGEHHHAYIVIDYDPDAIDDSLPTSLSNNFYFVLTATQPSADSEASS